MSRRLPAPKKPKRPACVVDDAELAALERLAAQVRLSVSSFIRVALIEATAHPERAPKWIEIAETIIKDAPADQPKPGRPKEKK